MKISHILFLFLMIIGSKSFSQRRPEKNVKQPVTSAFGFQRIIPVINRDSLNAAQLKLSVKTKTTATERSKFQMHLPLDNSILTSKEQGVVLTPNTTQK